MDDPNNLRMLKPIAKLFSKNIAFGAKLYFNQIQTVNVFKSMSAASNQWLFWNSNPL